MSVTHHSSMLTVLDVVFDPPPELQGYPSEHVRVAIRVSGELYAVPVAGECRRWKHRYPHLNALEFLNRPAAPVPWEILLGSLCLEYPSDPSHLRWHWRYGIDGYLRVVQRHLWFEEYARRHDGEWPVEDAPHGNPIDGEPHPILTPALRNAS